MFKRIATGETTISDYYLAIIIFVLSIVGGGILGFLMAVIFKG